MHYRYLKQFNDYGNVLKTQRVQIGMPLRDLENSRVDGYNVSSHAH